MWAVKPHKLTPRVSRRSLIPAPCHVRRHRAPIDPRNSMAQGQVKTSGFTYKETYDLFNQQLSLLNVSPWYIVAPRPGGGEEPLQKKQGHSACNIIGSYSSPG